MVVVERVRSYCGEFDEPRGVEHFLARMQMVLPRGHRVFDIQPVTGEYPVTIPDWVISHPGSTFDLNNTYTYERAIRAIAGSLIESQKLDGMDHRDLCLELARRNPIRYQGVSVRIRGEDMHERYLEFGSLMGGTSLCQITMAPDINLPSGERMQFPITCYALPCRFRTRSPTNAKRVVELLMGAQRCIDRLRLNLSHFEETEKGGSQVVSGSSRVIYPADLRPEMFLVAVGRYAVQ